jgi:leucyl-tRNA synthetase
VSEPIAPEETAEQAPDIHAIQNKWQAYWDENGTFLAGGDEDPRPRKYVLAMFPYPSGDMHMGHASNYLYSDIVARYWRHRGHNVLQPIGWDSFGLPAENAAIQRGADPREWTYGNIAQQRESLGRYGVSFDWSRVLHTSDPEYYQWNQWLFQQMYDRGLAYRTESPVNWCPNDQTVRPMRRNRGEEEADAVVLQDHRLRRPSARRPRSARGTLAAQGAADAAQLDRPLDRRRHRLRDRGTR